MSQNQYHERSWFKREISIGTLLQLATMLFLAVGAYYRFDSRVSTLETAVANTVKHTAQQDAAIADMVNNQTRLTTIIEERTKGGKL